MKYNIDFDERALKEWSKLDSSIKEQFRKKLKKLQDNPFVGSARLGGGLQDCYKIKLRTSGYRLVYKIIEQEIVIFIIAVGKRKRKAVYQEAGKRL